MDTPGTRDHPISTVRKTKGVLQGVGDKLREYAESESRPASGRLRSPERY
jgi:hypothetical protein